MENKKAIDSLTKYGRDFQIKCISCLISDRSFIERINDIIEVDFFESDANKWVVKESIKYFNEYKDLPTLTVFKIKVDEVNDELLKRSIVDNLKLVYQKVSDNDLKFVKEQFLEFCKNQKLKNAIIESADLLALGQYEKIKNVVDHAMKAALDLLSDPNTQYEKIIIVRPAVEAEEKLGSLPGNVEEKLDPYIFPSYYLMNKIIGKESREKLKHK